MPLLYASHRSRALSGGLAAVLLTAVLAGCSGGREDDGRAPVPAPTEPPRAAAGWDVEASVVGTGGRLDPATRRRVGRAVERLVEQYLDAAFVERARGEAAFPGFTPAARTLAVRDRRVLSGAGLEHGSVTPRSASAYVTVLAPGMRPVGATARVRVRMRLDGAGSEDGSRTVALRGRLLLTPSDRSWRVFGYDLARSGASVRGEAR